jgi:hypothetical protein
MDIATEAPIGSYTVLSEAVLSASKSVIKPAVMRSCTWELIIQDAAVVPSCARTIVNVVPETPVHLTISVTELRLSDNVKYITSPPPSVGNVEAFTTVIVVAEVFIAAARVDLALLPNLIAIRVLP